MKLDVENIKKLRGETGAGVMEVKEALENAGGNYDKAKSILMGKVSAKAANKADRPAKEGLVHAYIHSNGKVGSLVLVGCETDFVARTDDFKKLCHEVAMQVCTEDYASVEDLMKSEYIRGSSKKISDLVEELTAKVGEKIEIKKFVRFSFN